MSERQTAQLAAAKDETDATSTVFGADGTAPGCASNSTLPPSQPVLPAAHYISPVQNHLSGRPEFEAGAAALGLIGSKKTLKPQQFEVADVCNSLDDQGLPLYTLVGLLLPRRSAKTTTLIALAIGRCLEREDYLVGWTFATTAAKVQQRFKQDIAPELERAYPDEDSRPFKIVRSNGHEQIVFDNGSRLLVLTPHPDAFRSEAFDLIIIDEAGEATPQLGEDLMAGALPTMDTRPGAQLWVAGTAGEYRKGNLLWDQLEEGRQGLKGSGIVEYSADDFTSVEEVEDWATCESLVRKCHPGIGTLTGIDAIERNHRKMLTMSNGITRFMREYLGIFGDIGGMRGMVNPAEWNALELNEDYPAPPERFALAISSDGIRASIEGVWRVDGVAYILQLDHREGTAWLGQRAAELSRKYQTPIIYDNFGAVLEQVELMQQMRPRPRLQPTQSRDTYTAAARFMKEVSTGNLKHWGQAELTSAVLRATKRPIRNDKAWSFGHSEKGDDITGIEAAALALRAYDNMPVKRALPRMTIRA